MLKRTLAAIAVTSLTIACGPGDAHVHFGPDDAEFDETPDVALDSGVETLDMGSDTPDVANEADVEDPPDVSDVPDEQPVEVAEPCPRVRVTVAAGIRLNVRPGPNTNGSAVGGLYRGMVVTVVDTVEGQSIDGEKTWYEIEAPSIEGFITAKYAECTEEEVSELLPPNGFYLPLECDRSARVSQGNSGSYSHNGRHRYAWDFSLGLGTPLVAIADGIVINRYAGTAPGSACDGGGQSCAAYANHVVLLHGDNTTSTYRHLSRVDVKKGEFVPRGVTVGLSGQTGWSTGPHAHVMRMENCGSAFPPQDYVCQSIPTKFKDVSVNGGVPRTGDTVKSGNCIPLNN